MYTVVIALLPALAGAVYFFGLSALWLTLLAVVTCIATEGIIQKLTGKQLTIWDGSAIVTGILLAFNLPGGSPWWIPVIGSIFAIGVGKMTFGGLGHNPLNPALLGRVFLQLSWPVQMTTTWILPRGYDMAHDAETMATPLDVIKQNLAILQSRDQYSIETVNMALSKISDLQGYFMDLFVGRVTGCIGETSVMLLLIGAALLLFTRYIDFTLPFSFIFTVGFLTWVFGGYNGLFTGFWLYHVLSGGLILGAFYMATDMVTSPITPTGRLFFGVGCGVLTTVIRLVGGYPEGVSYAILLMNLTVPLINRYTRPSVFGEVKSRG